MKRLNLIVAAERNVLVKLCSAVLALLMLRIVGGPPAQAASAVDVFSVCNQAIAAAERKASLPAQLLHSIGLVESGRPNPRTGAVGPWPWTINAEGTGFFFDTKEQAIAAVQALQARGVQSIDVGCMQINLMHHPGAFATLDQAFEPQANVAYAARFLNQLFVQTSTWPKAAAAYHSQTPELGADYLRRVMALWPLGQIYAEPSAPDTALKQYTAELADRVAGETRDRARLYAEMRGRPAADPRKPRSLAPQPFMAAAAAERAPKRERNRLLAMNTTVVAAFLPTPPVATVAGAKRPRL